MLMGGDGTCHEGVNGLLMREDGKRVPVGFLQNGTDDNTAEGLAIGINNIYKALSYMVRGQTIKMDVVKVVLDHENDE